MGYKPGEEFIEVDLVLLRWAAKGVQEAMEALKNNRPVAAFSLLSLANDRLSSMVWMVAKK